MKRLFVTTAISLFLYNADLAAQCISSGWHNATSFSTDNSTGVYDFAIPANAQVSDNNRADASALISLLSGNTYYLRATGFGFSIPSYAIICGVSVEVECRGTGLILTAAI